MQLLFHYLKHYRKILFGALILAAVNQVFSLLDPQIFRIIVDRYAMNALSLTPAVFLRGVLLLLLASMGVAFVSRVAKNFQDYYVNVVTQRAGARLYADSVAHTFSLPYAVFEDQRSGELLQKLQKARLDSQALIASFVNVVFFSLVGIIFVLVYTFFVHWTISVAFFLIIPFLGGTTFFVSRSLKRAQQEIVAESAVLAGSTTETLRNVELVKSLGLEHQETKRLNAVNNNILSLELKKVRLIRSMSFIQGTLINATRAGILFLMLWLIAHRAITLGEFFSIFIYSFFIFSPLTEFGTVASQYQEARASMEALASVLTLAPELAPETPVHIDALESVEFRKVSFAYGNGNESLRGITLSVRNGETVAFVGPSGSGKTTLVKLIVGLHAPTEGSLLVNGVNMQLLSRDALRKRIGYVSQETQLFAGTIRENLLFVRPEATDVECWEALRQAAALTIAERASSGLDSLSHRSGKGLDTRIGEGGIKISGGERQRLAIARALLRNPDLIIFDEATSSLDSFTERAITETIREISKTRTHLMTMLVAHRLSTVAHADRIYVLEQGSIVETGTHVELVTHHGLYAALWREQGGR